MLLLRLWVGMWGLERDFRDKSLCGFRHIANLLASFADASTSTGCSELKFRAEPEAADLLAHRLIPTPTCFASAGTTVDGILFKDGTIFYSDVIGGGTYTPTERMRLTNTGNFGIGTSTPLVLLSVQNISTKNKDILDIASSSGASFYALSLWGMWGIGVATPSDPLM